MILNQEIKLPEIMSCIFALVSVSVYYYHKRKQSFLMCKLSGREEAVHQSLEAIINSVPEALL